MNFLLERRNRQYFSFLLGVCTVLLLTLLIFAYRDLRYSRELIFMREQQIVSALLREGIPREQIAAACAAAEQTEEGALFLSSLGHRSDISLTFFPLLRNSLYSVSLRNLFAGILFCGSILLCAVWYMRKQEQIYEEASVLVEQFAEGDFSGHFSLEHQNGTLGRLFGSVDQLARALRAGYEAECASRVFLKDMISDISHQLKTPLAALNTYTDIILQEPDHADTVRSFAGKSMQSLLRMEGLIQSLLKMVRLDAGNIVFEKRPVPVRELILQGTEALWTRAEQEHKQILLEGDADEFLVCDPGWTAEAIGNLVKNALDHTGENDIIRINWERSPLLLRITVADDGCGILPEDIHHIFKRFYRSRQSSDHQGAGLGLPLARAIVEGQGGTLSVTSEAGEGTVFCLSFFDH